jgi:hypothetical protein
MTARIFAYIVHKNGVVDDSAAELLAAAKKIDPAATPTAIVTGSGAEIDAVCQAMCSTYPEVWKVASESLAYPNAELIRKALVKVLPQGSILLVAHNHFGIDLAPGLSIKLNAAFVSDVVAIDGIDGSYLKGSAPGVWRAGKHARALRHFDRRGTQSSSWCIQAGRRSSRRRKGRRQVRGSGRSLGRPALPGNGCCRSR